MNRLYFGGQVYEGEGHHVGKQLTATDIKERLIQTGDAKSLLMWPPNLFAFTSYILGLSGAYQVAVSPPRGYVWPPTGKTLRDFVRLIPDEALRVDVEEVLLRANSIQSAMEHAPEGRRQSLWTFLVREAGQIWRGKLDLDDHAFGSYIAAVLRGEMDRPDLIPSFLLGCWAVFDRLCMRSSAPETSWDVSYLLCNKSVTPQVTAASEPVDVEPSLNDRWLACIALLAMHAIADETCIGWGTLDDDSILTLEFASNEALWSLYEQLSADQDTSDKRSLADFLGSSERRGKSSAQRWAEATRLDQFGTLATINPYRARVLPKRHTPDIGITLRSLSSNLAFHRSAIDVVWSRGPVPGASELPVATRLAERMAALNGSDSDRDLSILLLPFPLEINGGYFAPLKTNAAVEPLSSYRFFTYTQTHEIIDDVIRTIEAAERERPVDIVVLPELALTNEARRQLERRLQEVKSALSFIITGVSLDANGSDSFPQNNAVYFKPIYSASESAAPQQRMRIPKDDELDPGGACQSVPFFQFKHHRWQLGRTQLQQYGLTKQLDDDVKWWEAINIRQRRVSFVNLGERLTICPLICEDLARQDPIADLIRHVGPSLVVAILMDGPQLRDRWSARYAGILSEDPGSAVLTLTSLGMVRRWNAPYRALSNSVALWSDENGPRELELASDASGLLLSVRVTSWREPVADGRLELHATSRLQLKDIVQVRQQR